MFLLLVACFYCLWIVSTASDVFLWLDDKVFEKDMEVVNQQLRQRCHEGHSSTSFIHMKMTHTELAKSFFNSVLFKQSLLNCKEFKFVQKFKRKNEILIKDIERFDMTEDLAGFKILKDIQQIIDLFPDDMRAKVKFGVYGNTIEKDI